MSLVAQEEKSWKRYLPHTVSTKEGAVRLYRQTRDYSGGHDSAAGRAGQAEGLGGHAVPADAL